ncbi:efflux RND transporter periplasmic adaptor subunit [Rhodoferax sp.]|uniref:efflux RND transporter periplasmic adaptor subunit n=1 Tax=Rhodoferax sp. TaxID=50421 RepID=UPI002761DAE8|nr:efflux RND transporter periplasmic adaptor subunit [Rhodoferax sp.]
MSPLQAFAKPTVLKRRSTLWIGGAILMLALGATALATLGSGNKDAKAAKPTPGNATAATPAPLEFAEGDIFRVKTQALARAIQVSGTLMPLSQAVLKSTVSGAVHRVLVREGETVQQGAVVAEIDTTDASSRLEAAQADQAERRARLAIAERNRETNQTLLKQNFISQNAFDQLTSTQQANEAAVRWADAQVKLAKKAIDDAMVRAPISGTVAKRFVNGGERVSPEAPILSVVDLTRMELEATVPASEVAAIAHGQPVQFRVDGFGARAFIGRVERINPVAEAGSRAIKVFVSVPNPDGALRGGMFAEGAVTLAKASQVPAMPLAAVFEEAGQSYAYTVEDGKVVKRAVSLGQRDEATGMVAVTSGIAEGVPVVRIRMTGLKAGAPAVLRSAPPKTAPPVQG